jgi:peroxiredoxin
MRVSVAACLLAWSLPAFSVMPPLPRKSPEFTITEPSGKQILLSSYRGKVVVLAWVHTTCIYCQALTIKLNKLYAELGPRGFQPVEVAWNEGAKQLIPGFVQQFGVEFPVGYSEWAPIMNYMGFSVLDRPVTPLVVVIDRKGIIQAQTPPEGDSNLQNEAKLRALIERLLRGGPAAGWKAAGTAVTGKGGAGSPEARAPRFYVAPGAPGARP